MFEAIERGEIKALWVMATNPAVSLPRAGAVRDALEQARAVRRLGERRLERHGECRRARPAARRGLGREGRHGDQFRAAHLAPARASCRCPARRSPDWWIVREVARRMGFADGFAYQSAADIFREHAALSAFENDGTRDFDLGALAHIDDAAFDALDPVTWPRARGASAAERARASSPTGGFFTPDRKARFVAPEPPALRDAATRRLSVRPQHRPRARPVAHHDAHRARARASASTSPEPFVEVHPDDARCFGSARDFARVATAHGDGIFKVAPERRPAARRRCSCRSTGAARPLRRRAPATWSRRTPIRFRASRRPRRRRRRSHRSRSPIAASR